MIESTMQKRVMNGSVVPMLEKPKHDAIVKETSSMINTFYLGDKLTDLELDIERMYISEKLEKSRNYAK